MSHKKSYDIEFAKNSYDAYCCRRQDKLEKFIMDLLIKCPMFIREVPRQTPEFIKAALTVDGSVIKYLREEPTEEYRNIAIRSDPEAISLIKNPTKSEIKIAITANPNAVIYIKDKYLDVSLIRLAIKKKPLLIGFFNNLDKETKVIGYTAYFKELKNSGIPDIKIKKKLNDFSKGIGLKLDKNHFDYMF